MKIGDGLSWISEREVEVIGLIREVKFYGFERFGFGFCHVK